MLRSIISPIWSAGSSRFPLSTKISSLRSLHQESKIFKFHRRYKSILQYQQHRGKKYESKGSSLFKAVPVQTNRDDINVGAELTGKLDKGELLKILNKFTQKAEIKTLSMEHGLDGSLQRSSLVVIR